MSLSKYKIIVLCDDYEEVKIEFEAFINFLVKEDYKISYINDAAYIVTVNNSEYKFMSDLWLPFVRNTLNKDKTILMSINDFISTHYLDPYININHYIGLPKILRREYDLEEKI